MSCDTMRLEFRLSKVGFPIRKSMDQSFFAAPHGLSQRSTSFIASAPRHPPNTLKALDCSHYQCPHTRQNVVRASALGRSLGRAPSIDALRGGSLIRKTSLLRKIEPTARRSSFAEKDRLQPAHLAMNKRRNGPGDIEGPARLLARSNSDRSPLYDVRNPAFTAYPGNANAK